MALVILVNVFLAALKLANDALSTRQWIGALATWAFSLAFATVGAVILARRPGNYTGWLCWPIGFTLNWSNLSGKQVREMLTDNDNWSARRSSLVVRSVSCPIG